MKFSLLLAAVLSIESTIAFPHDVLETTAERSLIRRGPGGSHGSGGHHRSSSSESDSYIADKPRPGYHDTAKIRKGAGGMTREKAREIAAADPSYPRGQSIPVTNDRGPPKVSSIQKEKWADGKPNARIIMKENGGSHLGHEQYNDATFGGKQKEMRYLPKTDAKHDSSRRKKIGGIPKAGQLPGRGDKGDVVVDETHANSYRDTPYDPRHAPKVAYTAGYAGSGSSVHIDSPIQKKAGEVARQMGGTVSYDYDKSAPRQPYYPAVGPYHSGNADWGKPKEQRSPKGYHSRHSSSSGESRRSRSPKYGKRAADDQFDWRDYVIVSVDLDDSRSKRDAVEMGAESDSDQNKGVVDESQNFKEEYEQYLQAYDATRSNATDIILPFIEDMVLGSTSDLVWNAAWEIMSLADPGIMVRGPTSMGMHAFDGIEDEMRENGVSEDQMDAAERVHGVLIAMYQDTWQQAYDALNASGILEEMDTLLDELNTPSEELATIKGDTTGTDSLNEFFLGGPSQEMSAADNVTTPTNGTSLPRVELEAMTGTKAMTFAGEPTGLAEIEDLYPLGTMTPSSGVTTSPSATLQTRVAEPSVL
ncbi:MAG: hypothetical protein Q9174_002649 [Haloplaca sp. 1 TL-2023]